MGSSCFGQRLLEARKAADWTQERLGDAVAVHWVTVNRWEASARMPRDPQKIEKAADALGVHLLWLMTGAGPMRKRRAA